MVHFLFLEHLECRSSLGMENGNITDTQITASSKTRWRTGAYRGRLHLKAAGVKKGAWSTDRLDIKVSVAAG